MYAKKQSFNVGLFLLIICLVICFALVGFMLYKYIPLILPMSDAYLYIPSAGISVTAISDEYTTTACDNNDVCINYDILNSNDPVVFGHYTNTLKDLKRTKIGDIIQLKSNGINHFYKVLISEIGVSNEQMTDIVGVESEKSCLYGWHGKDFIHLFTCHDDEKYGFCRWIVVAEEIK